MSTLLLVLLIVGAVLLALALGGAVAQGRRMAATEAASRERISQADHDLAAAVAADRGWERERLEAAARAAFAEQHPGQTPESLVLVEVVDRPGTDEDRAAFEAVVGGATHRIELERRGDDWSPA